MENDPCNKPLSEPESENSSSGKRKFSSLLGYLRKSAVSKEKRTLFAILIILFVVIGGGIYFFASRGILERIGDQEGEGKSIFSGKLLPPHDFFSGFSDFAFDNDFKKDFFILKPENSDSLGVAGDSAYILKSKEVLGINVNKNNLKIEPAIEYDIQKISDTEWKIKPVSAFQPNALVKITLADYLEEGGVYSWAYQVRDNFKVLHSIPRDFGTNVPINSGLEITFSHDNFFNYEDYFELTPAVSGRFEKHGRTLVYVPTDSLGYGNVYTVHLKKGLPLAGSDQVLAEDFYFSFETQIESNQQKNAFSVVERSLEFTTEHQPIIQVIPQNEVKELRAEIFQFTSWEEYLDSLKQWNQLPWWSYSKNEFQFDPSHLKMLGSADLEIKETDGKKYIELPESFREGFYLVQIARDGRKVQVWIQVSDLAAYYNVTKTKTIVWVNNAKKDRPANNVEISLIGGDKSYTTSDNGIAEFATPEEIISSADDKVKKERLYLKISKDEDMLIVPASKVFVNYWWARPAEADNYWRYFYTDRPLYQTTDTINYWGLLKPRNDGGIDEKITVTLFKEGYVDYYYQPVSIVEQEIKLSELHTFEGKIEVADLRPDYYSLEIRIGDKMVQRRYINIKSYTKPAFDLKIIPDRKVAFAGEDIKLKVKANFFEGTPVPNLELVLNTPEGDRNLTTDQNGEADLAYTKEYADCTKEYSCWPVYAYLKILPANSELAEIEDVANVRFYGSRVYVDAKTEYPEKGIAEIKMDAKMIDLGKIEAGGWRDQGDDIAAGAKIEGKIVKITYIKNEVGTGYDFINKRTYKTYNYGKKEEEVGNFSGETDKEGKYIFKKEIEPETSYRVEYKIYDKDNRFKKYSEYLYYYDGKSVNHYTNRDGNYYWLDFNQDDYSLGERAELDFKNNDNLMPEGQQRYLYMQLKNGLQEYSVADGPEYDFTFNVQDIPNINVSAVYFDGVSYVVAESYYSNQQARYRYDDRNLDIKITPDKEAYRPGENVSLDIRLKDKNNEPVRAEINLNLVDEAYYSMIESVASPLETLYAAVGNGSVFSHKTHYSHLQSVVGAEKGGCFAAGTMVSMADGSEKKIEMIEKGDKIMTISDPVSKEQVEGEVSEVWKHTVAEYVVINNELKVTPEHQIFSNNRFIDAGLLKEGDWMLNLEGESIFVTSIAFEHEIITVYNLRVDPQHTFFAGGVYVHNEEKGGGPREFFTDAVLFETVRTNSAGEASVNFKLPDNITSWRITSQAISKELGAGVDTTKIPVTLPVFADVTIGEEYLVDDKPVARMRAFGTALGGDDQADFSLQSPTLGIDNSQKLPTKAFVSVFYSLPDLQLGQHEIVYNLNTVKGSDSIKLPLEVIASRLEAQVAKYQKLTTDTKIEPINNLPMAIVLSDEGRNQLYQPLQSLSWSYGDRVDQKYARKKAQELLSEYYQEEIARPVNFNAANYQLSSGGISLLPYSSEELELSARMVAFKAEGFDKRSLVQYFFEKLEDKESTREEISWALFGLAESGEPVLTRINSWLAREDLGPQEQLYLAQALFDLGDEQRSLEMYREILSRYGQKKDPQILVKTSENVDEMFKSTALAATLAASLNVPEAEGLFDYLLKNQVLYGRHKNSENLFNLEKLSFIDHRLPQLKPSPSEVAYELQGREEKVKVTGGVHSFQLDPRSADSLKFTSVTGDVGLSVLYTKSFALDDIERDPDISLKRSYIVDEEVRDSFSESDMVEIRLYPSFKGNALAGDYQVTDILPSGLAPISKLYKRSGREDYCNFHHPYLIDDQMVKFKVNRNFREARNCGKPYLSYYARVKNRGTYKAEPAVIQSFINPDFVNHSDNQTIKIGE